jgi:hypothetical protein
MANRSTDARELPLRGLPSRWRNHKPKAILDQRGERAALVGRLSAGAVQEFGRESDGRSLNHRPKI